LGESLLEEESLGALRRPRERSREPLVERQVEG
jgi:hypothetical protein